MRRLDYVPIQIDNSHIFRRQIFEQDTAGFDDHARNGTVDPAYVPPREGHKSIAPEAEIGLEDLFLEFLQVIVPKPADPHPLPIRDADDKWVLASAIAGEADVLVTGDADLLEIAPRSPLPIVNPRGFWDMLRGGSGSQD